ncbi:hypothetical protein BO85DRAFT_201777 [Aspergillus piperis CBS 112811]|uniref:Uncharacterized protein n=1 Tax=Aspergillus piperis CBS 112811 TaxID=1448313 RepID=A0A8G1QT94_9EURO|nr:hypothetical protein BO85DRAFT_201777 [Aspergillus piperis CBS 112811]RAH52486.1 hypothetical protein BO85DRAFT_201777 [Aspergillus piperis CBS 112811]
MFLFCSCSCACACLTDKSISVESHQLLPRYKKKSDVGPANGANIGRCVSAQPGFSFFLFSFFFFLFSLLPFAFAQILWLEPGAARWRSETIWTLLINTVSGHVADPIPTSMAHVPSSESPDPVIVLSRRTIRSQRARTLSHASHLANGHFTAPCLVLPTPVRLHRHWPRRDIGQHFI